MKSAADVAGELNCFKTFSIFSSNSSTDFVMPVTTSRGTPLFPIKKIEGIGTSLSNKEKCN